MEIFGNTRLHGLWLSFRRFLGLKESSSDYKADPLHARGPSCHHTGRRLFSMMFLSGKKPWDASPSTCVRRRSSYGGGNQWLHQTSAYLKELRLRRAI